MEKITDLDLQAFVDNELDGQERSRIMHEIMNSTELLQRIQELAEQKKLLQNYWRVFKNLEEH